MLYNLKFFNTSICTYSVWVLFFICLFHKILAGMAKSVTLDWTKVWSGSSLSVYTFIVRKVVFRILGQIHFPLLSLQPISSHYTIAPYFAHLFQPYLPSPCSAHTMLPQMAERLELPTLEHEVTGLNSAGGGIRLMAVQHFIAQNLSLSPFCHLSMT